MLALIDGDIVAFRAAAGASTKVDFGEGACFSSNPDLAHATAVDTVRSWQYLSGCDEVLVCFTGVNNFRKRVLPSYKAHRKSGKPPDYWTTVECVSERFPTRTVDGLEADDVMGILATTARYLGAAVVVTIDKDLRTVPGVHFNPLKDPRPVQVTEAQGDYYWLTQTLTGDTTDGYKGIPGCGPAKALKILGPPSSALAAHYWPKVVAAYRQAGLTEEDALVQARVARILRRADYDTPNKEILLWHPTMTTRLSLLPAPEPTEPEPSLTGI